VGPAAYTEIVTGVNGDGTYHTSVGFVSNATGTWHWVATYNGDANNNPVSDGLLDEPVTIPQQADLGVTKTVSNAAPNVGDIVTYPSSLHTLGPDAATDVTLTDRLPAGLTFVSASASQGTYDPATGLWAVGTVLPGATETLVIRAQVVSAAPAPNTITISHSDQFDPDLANNTASVPMTPNPERPAIHLVKLTNGTD